MKQDMGWVFAEVELLRGGDLILAEERFIQSDQIRRCTVNVLVNSGGTMLAISAIVKQQLDLKPHRQIEAELADGSNSTYEVVGPVEVRCQNRQMFMDAPIVPNSQQVLLGAIPMEGMDVLIDPKRERLIVNPDRPNVARMLLM